MSQRKEKTQHIVREKKILSEQSIQNNGTIGRTHTQYTQPFPCSQVVLYTQADEREKRKTIGRQRSVRGDFQNE